MNILIVRLFVFLFFVKCIYSNNVSGNAYIDIRDKQNFVDKTPFIYEFLQHKYLFISAPNKFGKSTNLDMLYLFLSNHRPKQSIENYFVDTKIWSRNEFVKTSLGQYPVIYLRLNCKEYPLTYEGIVTSFTISLHNAFIEHRYLLKSEKLSEERVILFVEYTDLTKLKLNLNDTVTKGLGFLAQVLFEHHAEPVILLVDDFGKGITEGIIENQPNADLCLIGHFYLSILNNTFCSGTFVSHALLTGENWLHGLQGPAVSLLEHAAFLHKIEFSCFYGFTYDEVDSLFTKFNISKNEKSEVMNWYCGYSTVEGLFKVCNPYSILQYLANNETIVYWKGSNYSSNVVSRMVDVDSLKKYIINLVMKNPVEVSAEKYSKLVKIELIKGMVKELPQYCETFFLKILLEAGYLTFSENLPKSTNVYLKFPNEEVQSTIMYYTL